MELILNMVNTTQSVAKALKTMPKNPTGRKLFIKQYNRRPMTKKRKAAAIMNSQLAMMNGVIHHSIISSTPIPNYKTGLNKVI